MNTLIHGEMNDLDAMAARVAASEELLRLFIKHTPAAIAMLDTELRYLEASDRWLSDYHLEGREIIGRSHYEIFPDIPQHWKNIHQRVLGGAVESCAEDPFPRADGSMEWLQWEARPWRAADGEIGGIIFFTQVITARKEAEARSRESEARFTSAFRYAPIGMTLATPDGRWQKVNRAFCEMVGYSEAELLGGSFQDITHPPDLEASMENVRRIIAGESRSFQIEKRYVHKRGHLITALVGISLIRDLNGEPRYFIGQIQDITERRAQEQAVRFNEQRYRSLVEATTAVVWDTGASGEFEVEQPSWAAFTGQTFPELRGWGWLTAIHPDDQAETARIWSAAVASRTVYEVEHRLRARDQTFHHMRVRAVPILTEDGTLVQWIGMHTDITERKRAELALRESEERFSGAFEHTPIGMALVAPDGRWIKVNRALCALVGYSDAELLTRTFQDITHPDDLDADLEFVRRLLAGEVSSYQMEKRYIHARAHFVTVLLSVSLVRDDQGEPLYFVTQIQDITARKRAEAALETTHQELIAASRRAGMAELATAVLHNVGNVLNSVNVASTCVSESLRKSKAASLARVAALLREHEADLGTFFASDPRGRQLPGFLGQLADHLTSQQEAALEELGHLQKNIEHIKEIVARQQNPAKTPGGIEAVQVVEVMEDALRMSTACVAQAGVRTVREFATVPPLTVDKHKVLQILVNLVRNAQQACAAAERPDKTLTLRVSNGNGRVKMAVADNGVGIPPENLARIFNHGFTTKEDGHGFGLHSAAQAAREMGGALRVESAGPGLGTTFTLELPADPYV